jgi:hypothetical protein
MEMNGKIMRSSGRIGGDAKKKERKGKAEGGREAREGQDDLYGNNN